MRGQKTGGRVPGSTNKATRAIKEIAQAYGPDAIEKLWTLACGAESEAARVTAIKEILDRGYGKPHQTAEITHISTRASELSDDELAGIVEDGGSEGTAETPVDPSQLN